MGIIEIEGMEFYAYHGCFEEEKVVGNRFLVNLTLACNMKKASETDNINDAVNYQTAYLLVKAEMEKKSDLLENIANRILESLHTNLKGIIKATVKISKMNPPMGGQIEKVSVTMSK